MHPEPAAAGHSIAGACFGDAVSQDESRDWCSWRIRCSVLDGMVGGLSNLYQQEDLEAVMASCAATRRACFAWFQASQTGVELGPAGMLVNTLSSPCCRSAWSCVGSQRFQDHGAAGEGLDCALNETASSFAGEGLGSGRLHSATYLMFLEVAPARNYGGTGPSGADQMRKEWERWAHLA